MSTLQDRLQDVMARQGWTRADVVRISGQSSSVVSQWLGHGSKTIHTIGKLEAAEALARAAGVHALWLAKGIGPRAPAAAQGADRRAEESPAPYRAGRSAADLVDELGTLLEALPPDAHARAVAALQAFAVAPDSARARRAAAEALGAAPGRALSKPRRSAA